MNIKKVIVDENFDKIHRVIVDLYMKGFKSIEIHFFGSRVHNKYKLRRDVVLIKAKRS